MSSLFDDLPFRGIADFTISFHKWYEDNYRKYHTKAHAIDVAMASYHMVGSREQILAALYHDAIYIVGAYNNEENSALVLIDDAMSLWKYSTDEDIKMVDRAAELIRGTTISHHLSSEQITDIDHAGLLDADLGSLALPYNDFVDAQKRILEENFLNPKDLDKSAQFLKQFLECREFIYHTDYCRSNWEQDARNNIIRLCQSTGTMVYT